MDKIQAEEISGSGSEAFEAVVDAFEAAWNSRKVPDIRSSIGQAPLSARAALLYELIRVDLEYRWKGNAGNGAAGPFATYTLDDYAVRHPELGDVSKLPVDLIVEEYRVRQRWGDRPAAAAFARRFPQCGEVLTVELSKVDREFQKEVVAPPAIDSDSSPALAGLAHIRQFDYHDFVLEAHLGSGGIGKVYRAWWKSQKRYVALKMLRKSWWRQPGADELFFREAEILVGLRHPNIVCVHGVGRTARGGCFLIIDLVDGGDLDQRTRQSVSIAQAIDWVAQAAEGLAFAHSRGVVHRDLKPSNLLLDHSGGLLIADFGLALVTSARNHIAESIVGTIAYMAPEQVFIDGHQVGPAADIFGLGAVLYALLTGRTPFEGRDLVDVAQRRLAASPQTQLCALRPDLPAAVERVVARCLEADPGERYTAEELATALRRLGPGG